MQAAKLHQSFFLVYCTSVVCRIARELWADLFIQDVFCNHGLPLEVISDRGPQLASTTKCSLVARACHETCQQRFTLRLIVKQSA